MEYQLYQLNQGNRQFIERKIKHFQQTKWLGPIGFLILNFLFVLSFSFDFPRAVIFYIILCVLTTTLCFFLGHKALLKLFVLVNKVEIKAGKINLETRRRKVNLPIHQVRFKKEFATVVDQDKLALVFVHEGYSYKIIIEFFEEGLIDNFEKLHLF
jgi:hypothetical protein